MGSSLVGRFDVATWHLRTWRSLCCMDSGQRILFETMGLILGRSYAVFVIRMIVDQIRRCSYRIADSISLPIFKKV